MVRVACVQMCSSRDVDKNIAGACALVREAAAKGAQLIATPEMTSLIEARRSAMLAKTMPEKDDAAMAAFAALAAEHAVYILAGSLAIKVAPDRLANRSVLFGPDGAVLARYDKVHMFDVDLPGGETYRESRTYQAGTRAVVCQTGSGAIGMTICYDMRFGRLYRALARAGAQIITVPSAFTRITGTAHWHVLLRARAIETGCFIVAPAQTGVHESGRETYGHSLVVSPWGKIIMDGAKATGVHIVDMDLDECAAARRKVPALHHTRAFSLQKALI